MWCLGQNKCTNFDFVTTRLIRNAVHTNRSMIQLSTQGKKKQYSTLNYECYLISNAYFIHQSLVRKPEFTIRVRILGEVNVLGLINKRTCITLCPLLVQYKARQNWKLQDLEFSCSYYFFIN